MLHRLFILFFSMIASSAFANSNLVCEPIAPKAQNKNIILPGVDQPHTTQVYFLKNVSENSLWLEHPSERKHAASTSSSYLRSGKWSALLLNRHNYTLSCAIIQPGKADYQDCTKAIFVCQPKSATVESKRKGSYWLVEDMDWDNLLKALKKKSLQEHPSSR